MQDIEAEDKILGPFTLKQFIFIIIDIILIVVAFRLAITQWLLAIPLLPPIALLSILAAPLGRDQPTETWLLAKIQFYIKPNKRIWNQTGVLDLVQINAPKKLEKHYTDGLDQQQVRSRLNALASTLDSRGWAVKNVAANMYSSPGYMSSTNESDRLVQASTLPQTVPTILVAPEDDIMDAVNNPLAKQMDQMIRQQTQENRQRIVNQIQNSSPASSNIGVGSTILPTSTNVATANSSSSDEVVTFQSISVAPGSSTTAPSATSTVEEKALLEQIHTDQRKNDDVAYHSHMKRLKTSQEIAEDERRAALEKAKNTANAPMTKPLSPATLELAKSDDLKVETIAKLANRHRPDDGEVVVSLR
jgi:hypothetical protein